MTNLGVLDFFFYAFFLEVLNEIRQDNISTFIHHGKNLSSFYIPLFYRYRHQLS